jgi:hypothetical protein
MNRSKLIAACVALFACTGAAQAETHSSAGSRAVSASVVTLAANITSTACKQNYRDQDGEISTTMTISESTLTITFPKHHKVAFADHTQYMDFILATADHPDAFAIQLDDDAILLVSKDCDLTILAE